MKKAVIFSRYNNWESKTLAIVDRLKFRDSLNWIKNIPGAKFNSITQLSNHALLLNVKKQDSQYECYLTSITSKTKSVELINGINVDLMEIKLPNGESRYIPKAIYKYTFTKEQFLNLLKLENINSINLKNQIKLWDYHNILEDWFNIIKVNECYYIDLDSIKNIENIDTLNVGTFKHDLSDVNLDIEVMKNIIQYED